MKRLLLLFVPVLCLLAACTPKPTTVHLKGQLVDMGSTSVTMRYNGASSMLGGTRDVVIETDGAGFFDTVIELSEPAYYSISRNTFYLSPGDDMEIYVSTTNSEATFEGLGGEVNTYMKKRLFPKGGSFLESGRNIKETFEETAALIDQLATERRNELEALTTASKEFTDLEGARITGDVVNSYFSYLSYSPTFRNIPKEEAAAKRSAFIDEIASVVRPLIAQFAADRYLDVAVVRDVFWSEMGDNFAKCFEGIPTSERRTELYQTYEYINSLRENVTPQIVDDYTARAASLKNEDFRVEFQGAIDKASSLLACRPAPDVEIVTPGGESGMLSKYKGTVLYVDFWATWCGPCIAESPYFNTLASKYKGRDIAFIQISTDTNHQKWMDYLASHETVVPQYNSTDIKLREQWAIHFIPRFVLIDRDFNIVNAYAERPSEEGIEQILDELLK